MGTVFCDNCGVSLLDETAKFCRACGKPTPPLSEVATKRFEQQPVFQNPTSPVGQSTTTPAYMAPFDIPAAPQTNEFYRKRKRNVILLAAMLAFLLLALGGLLIFLTLGEDGGSGGTPPSGIAESGERGSGGFAPGTPVPPVPPDPPVPPPPPPIGTAEKIDQSLIYPGSKETMRVTAEGVTTTMKLHSDDPVSKVAKWYLSKLKATNKFSIAGQTIIQEGDTTVVIVGGEGGAEIVITTSKDSKN